MFVVEPVRGEQAEEMVRMASRSMPGAIDPAHVKEEAACDACLVARDADTHDLLGFALARREEGCEAHIVALAVDAYHRDQGVGTALLRTVADEMVHAGAMKLRIEAREDDDRAHAFWARHGFRPEGLRRHVYQDGGDAVTLTRPI